MSGRPRLLPKRAKPPGLAPGSVIYTGVRPPETVRLGLVRYGPEQHEERRGIASDEALAPAPAGMQRWLDIVGLHDTELLTRFGERFQLHPLTLEDIASVGQRPKSEPFADYLYVVLRMLRLDGDRLDSEQVSLVLTRDVLLTFQERPGDVFEPVRERLRHGKGRIRTLGPDYLFYALLDVIVDNYFLVLEHYAERIEALEDEIFSDPAPDMLSRLAILKRELLVLRRAVWPLRDLIGGLLREESPLLGSVAQTFLRDVYDHVVQVIDAVETLRETLTSLHDAYLSSLSFRMNEVMKVLTIIATIFIPLSFLVGVYGMNFERMPELHLSWAYPALWLLMLAVSGAMLLYFRRRRWL